MNRIGKKVFQGTFWLTFSNLFNLVLASVATIFIARWLGPDKYGYISLIASIISLSMVLADGGVGPSTARFLAEVQENEQKTWTLLKRTLRLRVFILIPICFGLYCAIDWLSIFLNAPLLPQFGVLIALLLFLQTMQRWIAKVCEGTGNTHFFGKINLTVNWTNPTFQLVLVLSGFGLFGVFVGQAVAYFLTVGIFLFFLVKKFYVKTPFSSEVEHIVSKSNIISYAFPLMIIHASFFVYMQSDILMLKYFGAIQEVSYYGIATKMADLTRMPVAAFGASVAPLVLILKRESVQRAGEVVLKSLRYLSVAFTFVSLVALVYAKEIVEILFSDRYFPSAEPFQIYSIFIFFFAISSFVSLALDYSGLARTRMVLVAISAGFNVLLNIVLIPKYGMIGAAWTTQITYSPLIIIYVWLIAKHYKIQFVDLYKIGVKLFYLGFLAFIIFELIHFLLGEELILQLMGIPIGGSIYFYMAYKLKLVSKSELQFVFRRCFRR